MQGDETDTEGREGGIKHSSIAWAFKKISRDISSRKFSFIRVNLGLIITGSVLDSKCRETLSNNNDPQEGNSSVCEKCLRRSFFITF